MSTYLKWNEDSDSTQGGQFMHEATNEPGVCTQPRHVEAAVTRTRLGNDSN